MKIRYVGPHGLEGVVIPLDRLGKEIAAEFGKVVEVAEDIAAELLKQVTNWEPVEAPPAKPQEARSGAAMPPVGEIPKPVIPAGNAAPDAAKEEKTV